MEMTDLLSLWAMAEAAQFGIRIKTDDPGLLRQQLYKVRAESGAYKDLGIIIPSTEGQLWLVHADADERGRFDTIHRQPLHQGPGVLEAEGGGSEREQATATDIEELGEGEAE